MNVEEYHAVAGTVSLGPQQFTASWSPELSDALRARENAVFEEQVIRSLLGDLKTAQPSRAQR